ncbi:MAG: methionyl-tRNA formyltransferase, partial [Candidatus Paceibacteria bacterium]
MKVLFLLSDYVLHNSILSDYAADRPHDELAVVKIPLVLKGKGRRETAGRIVPQLSKRFVAGKITEFLSLALVTSLPKLLGRGAEFQRLRKLSRRLGCPFHRTENIMHSETLEFVREFAPDVIVSLCHQILREPLISMAPLGIVNVHPGLLPDYRGIQPYFWELSEGALEAGATLHLIEDERIDTGGILGRSSFAIQEGMSVQLNYYLTIRCASNVLARC